MSSVNNYNVNKVTLSSNISLNASTILPAGVSFTLNNSSDQFTYNSTGGFLANPTYSPANLNTLYQEFGNFVNTAGVGNSVITDSGNVPTVTPQNLAPNTNILATTANGVTTISWTSIATMPNITGPVTTTSTLTLGAGDTVTLPTGDTIPVTDSSIQSIPALVSGGSVVYAPMLLGNSYTIASNTIIPNDDIPAGTTFTFQPGANLATSPAPPTDGTSVYFDQDGVFSSLNGNTTLTFFSATNMYDGTPPSGTLIGTIPLGTYNLANGGLGTQFSLPTGDTINVLSVYSYASAMALGIPVDATQSLQAQIETGYVGAANNYIYTNMQNLQKALGQTQQAMSVLTQIQNLANDIKVTPKPSFLSTPANLTGNVSLSSGSGAANAAGTKVTLQHFSSFKFNMNSDGSLGDGQDVLSKLGGGGTVSGVSGDLLHGWTVASGYYYAATGGSNAGVARELYFPYQVGAYSTFVKQQVSSLGSWSAYVYSSQAAYQQAASAYFSVPVQVEPSMSYTPGTVRISTYATYTTISGIKILTGLTPVPVNVPGTGNASAYFSFLSSLATAKTQLSTVVKALSGTQTYLSGKVVDPFSLYATAKKVLQEMSGLPSLPIDKNPGVISYNSTLTIRYGSVNPNFAAYNSAINKWIVQGYNNVNGVGTASAGVIQGDLTKAITAGESLNTTQTEAVRNYLFIFQEFYSSATSMLQTISSLLKTMADNVAR